MSKLRQVPIGPVTELPDSANGIHAPEQAAICAGVCPLAQLQEAAHAEKRGNVPGMELDSPTPFTHPLALLLPPPPPPPQPAKATSPNIDTAIHSFVMPQIIGEDGPFRKDPALTLPRMTCEDRRPGRICMIRMIVVGLMLVGCGGGGGSAAGVCSHTNVGPSCTSNAGGLGSACSVWSSDALAQAYCTVVGGTIGTSCPTAGVLGCCCSAQTGGWGNTCYYTSSLSQMESTACPAGGGTFSSSF